MQESVEGGVACRGGSSLDQGGPGGAGIVLISAKRAARGICRYPPQKILDFRLSEIISGAVLERNSSKRDAMQTDRAAAS